MRLQPSAATLLTPSILNICEYYATITQSFKKEHTPKTETKEVVPVKLKEKRLICKGCNHNESLTLEFLQNRGITDKNAIATIMGNIRQESTFTPNICEGGARVSYSACRSGGFGLQFSGQMPPRYYGLGKSRCSYWWQIPSIT
jgi:hypothetical protein